MQAPILLTISQYTFKFDEGCFYYKKTILNMMKFCTYQDSCAALVCAKFCHDPADTKENIGWHILIKFEISYKFAL